MEDGGLHEIVHPSAWLKGGKLGDSIPAPFVTRLLPAAENTVPAGGPGKPNGSGGVEWRALLDLNQWPSAWCTGGARECAFSKGEIRSTHSP
jgi:hypothetical protein